VAKEQTAKEEKPKQYIPLEGIGGKVVLFLTIGMVIDGLNTVMTGASLALLPVGLSDEDPRMMVKLISDLVLGIGQMVIYLITAVAFCKWMFRAYSNLEWFGLKGLKTTPRMSIVYWFVPFFNMWRPYQYMKEIWQGSDRRAETNNMWTLEPPREFPLWWSFWLLNNFISQAVFRYSMKAEGDGLQLLDGMTLAADVCSILAAFFVIRIVKSITEKQHQKMHAMVRATEP
jgi:hypothetical protein